MLITPFGKNKIVRALSADEDALCYAKYVARQNAAGVDVTAATIDRQANLLAFAVNGVAEVVIGTYTGNSGTDDQVVYADANIASIQNLIDTINGHGAGMVAAGTTFNRWRAGWGDFRPGYVIGAGDGTVVGATNALLGVDHIGLAIHSDSSGLAVANSRSVGLGVPGARRGMGQRAPDHFESDYISTTAGVVTRRRWTRGAQQERHHGVVEMIPILTRVHVGCLFANNDIVVNVYDRFNQVIWSYPLGTGGVAVPGLSETDPVYGTPGSPMWVEVAGTGGYTDGNVTVEGYVNIA